MKDKGFNLIKVLKNKFLFYCKSNLRICELFFLLLTSFKYTNHANDINAYNKLNKKYNVINGKYSDWIGISLETLTEIIAIFRNDVIAKFKMEIFTKSISLIIKNKF